jgi:hypothetical protein
VLFERCCRREWLASFLHEKDAIRVVYGLAMGSGRVIAPEPMRRNDNRERPWATSRACVEAILWVLQTGAHVTGSQCRLSGSQTTNLP